MLINELLLIREDNRADRCIGDLLINYVGTEADDWRHFGWVVEDTDRGLDAAMPLAELLKMKVKGRTAIPTGRYEVKFTWSPKYNRMMLELQAVPAYKGIRIHSGNRPEDTEGCVCPGLDIDRVKGESRKSKDAVKWLEERMLEAQQAKHQVFITIKRK